MANERSFVVRYANWPPATVKIAETVLKGLDGLGVVRRAVGHAFKDKLQGEWTDGPDRVVQLDRDNPGVWTGHRLRPDSGKKPEPFYVLEV